MFPIQTRLLTPNKYSRPQTPLNKVAGIVIHWTANEGKGANAEANRRFFENRKLGRTGYGSAHYIVDNHEIVQCIPDNELGYHVGATSYKTSRFGSYPNKFLLGIEMCVNVDGDFKVVYDQTVQLTDMLLKKYGINPDTDVVRHFDITGKNCPAMFTSNHWGEINNAYAVKFGVGSNADQAWLDFKAKIKAGLISTVPKPAPVSVVKPAPAPAKKYPLPVEVLRKGDTGTGVKQLQVALNAIKFNCGTPDGSFGQNTEDAVRRFQSIYSNPADGVYGPKTRSALDKKVNG